MSLAPDPADKALDAKADGAFGGKPVNRRAGYEGVLVHDGQTYTQIEWLLRIAKQGGTLNAGEGAQLVAYFEERIEQARTQAYTEGYDEGHDDGYESAWNEVHEEEEP